MASRFGASSLHQRDSRSALFEGYTGDNARRPVSASPSRLGGYGYGYAGGSASPAPTGSHLGVDNGARGFRPATPNSRYARSIADCMTADAPDAGNIS
ncbi:protein transport protein bet1 [Colletotrichum tropicale]|nr:protein transport protein bet1 [Colletotrichum tropicale]